MEEENSSGVIAEFVATVPDIQSALSFSGTGSCRLKLDAPESEIAEVIKLAAFGREKALQITVKESK
jgi:hypothetical protein